MRTDRILIILGGENKVIKKTFYSHDHATVKKTKDEIKRRYEGMQHQLGFGVKEVKVTLKRISQIEKPLRSSNGKGGVSRTFKVTLIPHLL
jgi:hypothetical protein